MNLAIEQIMEWLFEKLLIDPSSALIKRWQRNKFVASPHGFVLGSIHHVIVESLRRRHSLKVTCSYKVKHDFYSTEFEYWDRPDDSDEAQALAKFLTGQRIVIRVSEANPEKTICLEEDQEKSASLRQLEEQSSIPHAK
ncbi:MAG TPA: hypothetical protein VHA33_03860 [Candidatus Angelobacter sp.]|jgi:hypothetical protein|nr:hypothetical protein [Candidatus Angelobacter sp.]